MHFLVIFFRFKTRPHLFHVLMSRRMLQLFYAFKPQKGIISLSYILVKLDIFDKKLSEHVTLGSRDFPTIFKDQMINCKNN